MFAFSQVLRLRVLLVSGLIAVTSLSTAIAASNFTTIDVPAAGNAANQGTAVTAIDAAGDVAGIYVDAGSIGHAFVLPAGGTISTFDAPGVGQQGTVPIGFDTAGNLMGYFSDTNKVNHGFVRSASSGAITLFNVAAAGSLPAAGTGKSQGTVPICINGSGEIAGIYIDSSNITHGFVRSATGTITTYDAVAITGTSGKSNQGIYFVSLNATGEVAGAYVDASSLIHGFVRSASGTITAFDAAGAGTGVDQGTIPIAIDAAGDVTGVFLDANNAIHGFVRAAASGTITTIDAPGAGTGTQQGTFPDAIDAAGDVSGFYIDANNVGHGFVLPANGTIVTYDAPDVNATASLIAGVGGRTARLASRTINASSLNIGHKNSSSILSKIKSFLGKTGGVTSASSGLFSGGSSLPYATASLGNLFFNSVNASGQIVGIYTNGDAVIHSYLRAANGTLTTFDAPNAGTGAQQGTGGLAINASGTIVGGYIDTNSVIHGFVFAPALTATTTAILSESSTSTYGGPITLTATVTPAPPNGETVYFKSGATTIGTQTLSGGSAQLTTTGAPAGTDSATAVYPGDLNFSGSTSNTVSQTVSKATSSTTLTSSPNPSGFEELVTLTATVSGQLGGVATGTMTFSNGSTTLGTAPVHGSAVFTFTALPQTTNTITAVYSGGSNFYGSTSNTISQVVGAEVLHDWTWMGGSSTVGNGGVYGTLGTPAVGNIPGSRSGAETWTDSNGNLWLMGGCCEDMWKFNPSTNEWTWAGGSKNNNNAGAVNYGTQGVAAATNFPGERGSAATWTDKIGNLWLFGGWGDDANGDYGGLNDLWEFTPSTGLWTWWGGSSTLGSTDAYGNHYQPGNYGSLGVASSTNVPASTVDAASWTDSNGNFWLFGGSVYDANETKGLLNVLWEFNPSTKIWTWMGGLSTFPTEDNSIPGAYCTLGTFNGCNFPGGRYDAASWTDSSGHFWLFGGGIGSGSGNSNDLWEFNPSTSEWAWMGGGTESLMPNGFYGLSGVYGTSDTPATANIPGGRLGASGWTDNGGNLWLFGGYGDDAYGNTGYLNDLWEFNPSLGTHGEWVWMDGTSTMILMPDGYYGQSGVYGALGTPAAANVPGGRGGASSWTDSSGNLWLFGGGGYAASGNYGALNDLWEYQPTAATTPALTATTTTLTPVPTPSPSYYGESVTLTASVTSSGGAPPNGENVTFLSGTTSLGTAQLSSGTAVLATTALPEGTDSITAVYGGDADFAGSTSTAVSQIVNKATSSVTTWPTASSITYGQTLASSTLSGGASTPAGSFAFTTPTTAPNAGTASQSVTFTPTDTTDYSTLTGTASVTVGKASSSTALVSSVNPSAVGQSVSFTATVTGQYGGTATGTVTFSNGSTSLGSASLSGGSASLATAALPMGTDSITAVYGGDTNFSGSTSTAVSQVVVAANSVPLTSGITPAFTSAGGAAFTLTVNGSGFISGSTVYWNSSALTTTYGSATQLTAQVPATDIVTGGITVAISVITPSPGGGTSNSFQFEVDSASGATTGPQFSSVTQTVTAGSPASYPVTLPSTVESASVTCLNLPTGATCSYSATTNTVTITTSSTTPKGTYQITVVFTETVSGAATSWILLPFLLLPLVFLRRRMATRGYWVTACLGLALIGAAAFTSGCGGGSSSTTPPPPQTHQVTSSGVVSLTVQ
jgi:N-acetylneuraminic acid mutarotase